MVLKLHRQFSHPSNECLRSLVTSAGIKDQEFLKLIETVSNECEVCKLYKNQVPNPLVGFPNVRVFNQTVAMDLKEYSQNVWFLHLIDLVTRYPEAAVIKSKDKDAIAKKLCQIWIAIFGSPHKFFSDNGGELSNEIYRDFCENFNIAPATGVAESPWSNGTCERHKTMVDTKHDFETALAWPLSAKNSRHSFYGFSSNQLVFGRNLNLLSVLADDPTALEGTSNDSQEGQQILVKHGGVYVSVHLCRPLHEVTPEACQDCEEEYTNVQKSETEHVVQKCRSVDEPVKQVVSDDDYDVSDKSQNSQIGTI